MIKSLEAIFRRFILLLLMLIVPALIGVGIVFFLPRSYQSSATLWALERYEIIGATGAESNLDATPADTQATALQELLQSRTFDVAVAKSTDLASTLNLSQQVLSSPQLLDNALTANISKYVQVTSTGTNLYVISYTNNNAQVADQVVTAVIKEFQAQGQTFTVVEGQRLLQDYQGQLTKAQSAANTATKNESAYLANHPNATTTTDPQYLQLDAARQQAQATVQNIQSTIATLNQEIATQSTGNGAFFETLDPPQQAAFAQSRSKLFITAGGVGAAIGLLVCVIYMLMIIRRDRSLYTTLDVQRATSYPVLMQVPQLSKATKSLVTSGISR